MSEMELGDLHPYILRALRNPSKRLLGAGHAITPEAKSTVKAIANRLQVARRLDIEDDLLTEIFEQASWKNLTKDQGNLPVRYMTENIVQAHDELRLPFKNCWVEFSGKIFNDQMRSHNWAVGSTDLKKAKGMDGNKEFDRVGVFCIQPKENQMDFHCFASIKGDSVAYMSILGRSLKGNQQPAKPKTEKAMRHLSILLFGMDFKNDPISEAAAGYVDMLSKAATTQAPEIFGEENTRMVFEEYLEPWAPYLTRVAWEALRVLNYPWVAKEPARVEHSRKGKRPNVTPSDSYYRCKVVLPKPDGVETRPVEIRKEAYGKRLHQVRGHWRVYKDEFKNVKSRTWITEHRRGNAKLGVVHKDYHLTTKKNKDTSDEI